MKASDAELLRRYARKRSEADFEELVRRRIDLVYSAALRQVNNDTHLAEDVTQAVFTDLAGKAATLCDHPALVGWLYTSTRFMAANAARTEQRRAAREAEAYAMNAMHSTPEWEADWEQIRPLLDEAMHALSDQEREAVLLRHFEGRSYAEIGLRFGLAEDAARMRINRALTKLHEVLAKRGVTSTALALAGLLSRNAVGAAPAHLSAKIAHVATTGAGSTNGFLSFLGSKIGLTLAAIVLTAGIATVGISRRGGAPVPAPAESGRASDAAIASAAPMNESPVSKSAPPPLSGPLLWLRIVTADTGKPIPDVRIECLEWGAGGPAKRKWFKSDRLGVCAVSYETDTPRLDLTAQKPPFADARVLWQRPLGDSIPTNYILRMERAVLIGGTVADADGNPVAGATVTWDLNVPDSTLGQTGRPNETYGPKYETMTDQLGRWQLARTAEAIFPYLMGGAKESNHLDSILVSTARDASARQQLREGSYVFKLGRAVTARGVVVDENGAPIPNATVLIDASAAIPGDIASPTGQARSGISQNDGRFEIGGCGPGNQRIQAKSPGFAALMGRVDLEENASPMRLSLQRGKLLPLRFVDQQGNPIPRAGILVIDWKKDRTAWRSFPTPSLLFTDQEGRVRWSNAPETDLRFQVSAFGFKVANSKTNEPNEKEMITSTDGAQFILPSLITVQPDGTEHIIVLEQDDSQRPRP